MTATKAPGAARYLPEGRGLDSLRAAAECCRGCQLFADATQTVFGHGHPGAPIMLVGEQPGDQEDRAGEPFVGPAGRLLARALEDAGIDPASTYETNAVKHFKFTRKGGKRRIHQKPGRTEVVACRPWLIAEIEAVRPQVVVCLGATAAQSLLGAAFRVSAQRGRQVRPPSVRARRGARAHRGGDGSSVGGVARSQRSTRRGLPAFRRRPARRAFRSRRYRLTDGAPARTCAICIGLRSVARSRIWVRQLKPSASTSAPGSASRSAGISLSSAHATDTS